MSEQNVGLSPPSGSTRSICSSLLRSSWPAIALGLAASVSFAIGPLFARAIGESIGTGDGSARTGLLLRLLVGGAVALPIAALAGRRKRWSALAATSAGWSLLVTAAMAVVPDGGGLAMLFGLAGVGDALALVALPLVLHCRGFSRSASSVISLSIFFASIGLGAIASAVANTTMEITWRGAFLLACGLVLPGSAAAMAVPLPHASADLEAERIRPALGVGERVNVVWATSRTGPALLALGSIGAVLACFAGFAPALLRDRWAQSTSQTAVVVAAAFFVVAVGTVLGERQMHRRSLGRSKTAIAMFLASVFGAGALWIPEPFAAFLVLVLLSFTGLGIGAGAAYATMADQLDDERTPIASALLQIALGGGGVVGLVMAGSIDRRFGTAIALGIVGLPVMLVAAARLATRSSPVNDANNSAPAAANNSAPVAATTTTRPPHTPTNDAATPLVQLVDIEVFYGQVQVLFGVNLTIHQGEIVALLGTNGAGKSTALKVIAGQVFPSNGVVLLEGTDITALAAERRVPLGLAQIPGGRAVFGTLTVDENLELFASSLGQDRAAIAEGVARTFEVFPQLEAMRKRSAQTLSGGEQQMLALGKALLLRPRLLCIDELSLGLAPSVVADLLGLVRKIHAAGTTVILVEQSVNVALSIAERAIFMEKGEVRFDGPARELQGRDDLLRSVFLRADRATINA